VTVAVGLGHPGWRRWLERETCSRQFIPEIDGLRFVAIFAVIFYHLSGFYLVKSGRARDAGTRLFETGHFGVPLFFVISGFVIALPFARAMLAGASAPPLRAYYLRRLTRLEPPYILNLMFLTAALIVGKGASTALLFPHLAASVLYSHTLVYDAFSLINGVAWSLEIEWQFYLLAPLLVTIFRVRARARRRALLLGCVLAWSALAQAGPVESPRFKLSLLFHGPYFLTGLLLSDFYVSDWREAPVRKLVWDALGATCWVGIVSLVAAPGRLSYLLPLLVLGAYVGAFRGRLANRALRWPAVYLVGGMCYTIYLYHFFFLSIVGNPALALVSSSTLPAWANVVVLALVVVPTILFGCAVLFVVAEKPFMKRRWPAQLDIWLRRRVPSDPRPAAL
jgi:peptidoglycan/LPS O-acetylase OafA/YrhL